MSSSLAASPSHSVSALENVVVDHSTESPRRVNQQQASGRKRAANGNIVTPASDVKSRSAHTGVSPIGGSAMTVMATAPTGFVGSIPPPPAQPQQPVPASPLNNASSGMTVITYGSPAHGHPNEMVGMPSSFGPTGLSNTPGYDVPMHAGMHPSMYGHRMGLHPANAMSGYTAFPHAPSPFAQPPPHFAHAAQMYGQPGEHMFVYSDAMRFYPPAGLPHGMPPPGYMAVGMGDGSMTFMPAPPGAQGNVPGAGSMDYAYSQAPHASPAGYMHPAHPLANALPPGSMVPANAGRFIMAPSIMTLPPPPSARVAPTSTGATTASSSPLSQVVVKLQKPD